MDRAPVLVLLDPALRSVAGILQQALGPGFGVAVGLLPPGTAWPGRYAVVVLDTADPGWLAAERGRYPGADLLAVTGAPAADRDPGLVPALFAAGADDVLTWLSVPELAARVKALARARAGQRPPATRSHPPADPLRAGGGRPGRSPTGRVRSQVLARLAGAKRRVAVGAVAAFALLVGVVTVVGARGSDASTAGQGGVTTRQLAPDGSEGSDDSGGFFGGQGGYGFGDPGSGGGSSLPSAGSSGAS